MSSPTAGSGYVGDLYAAYEVRFGRTPNGRWYAEVRMDGGERGADQWHRYRVKSAEAMLLYGARLVREGVPA